MRNNGNGGPGKRKKRGTGITTRELKKARGSAYRAAGMLARASDEIEHQGDIIAGLREDLRRLKREKLALLERLDQLGAPVREP